MRVEIEIVVPETGAREKHPCWETGIPKVYQTIIGEQIINVHVDQENVCETPKKYEGIIERDGAITWGGIG